MVEIQQRHTETEQKKNTKVGSDSVITTICNSPANEPARKQDFNR